MNEDLKWIANSIDVEEYYWPDEKPYVSVYSSHLRYKTVRFHSERPNIASTELPNLFTKEDVIKAQQELKQQKE